MPFLVNGRGRTAVRREEYADPDEEEEPREGGRKRIVYYPNYDLVTRAFPGAIVLHPESIQQLYQVVNSINWAHTPQGGDFWRTVADEVELMLGAQTRIFRRYNGEAVKTRYTVERNPPAQYANGVLVRGPETAPRPIPPINPAAEVVIPANIEINDFEAVEAILIAQRDRATNLEDWNALHRRVIENQIARQLARGR